MKNNSFVFIIFLMVCSYSVAQKSQKIKEIPITLELPTSENNVRFEHNGYLIIVDREDILKNYEDNAYYDWILAKLNTYDVLNLNETIKEINEHIEYSWYYNGIKLAIRDCFDEGRVQVQLINGRSIRQVNRVIDPQSRPFFSARDRYVHPLTGEPIFEYIVASIGCPNF